MSNKIKEMIRDENEELPKVHQRAKNKQNSLYLPQ
jgi:hypothetical protein